LSTIVKEFLQAHGLRSLVDKPTRTTSSSSTQIDVIFSNSNHNYFSDVLYSGISDHDILVTVRKWKSNKGSSNPKVLKSRTFKNFDSDNFCNDLRSADWSEVINTNDIDSACDNFTKITNNISDRHAPYATHRVSKKTPWINDDLRKEIKERDFLKKKAVFSMCAIDWNNFKSKRNAVNRLKNFLKRTFFNNKLYDNRCCAKKLWKTLKDLLPNTKANSTVPFVIEDGIEIIDHKSIANVFNKFYATIGSRLA
jgi:hypothetical protein